MRDQAQRTLRIFEEVPGRGIILKGMPIAMLDRCQTSELESGAAAILMPFWPVRLRSSSGGTTEAGNWNSYRPSCIIQRVLKRVHGCRRLLQNPSYYGLADTEEATLSGYLSRMVENIFTALQACTLQSTPWTTI